MTWRPFEPSREAAEAAREHNRCNKHDDCEAADITFKLKWPNGRDVGGYYGILYSATHCHADDCEECFGC